MGIATIKVIIKGHMEDYKPAWLMAIANSQAIWLDHWKAIDWHKINLIVRMSYLDKNQFWSK